MTSFQITTSVLALMLVGCGGAGGDDGTGGAGGSGTGGSGPSTTDTTDSTSTGGTKVTNLAQCPTTHVVSCDERQTNPSSGDPDAVITHGCIEVYSDGGTIAEAQAQAIVDNCGAEMNTAELTYVLGTGCDPGNVKEGCLAGALTAGFCQVDWIMQDDPEGADVFAGTCMDANLTPLGP